jgi:hypothetical protein
MITTWLEEVESIFQSSADETGGSRLVRFVMDGNCKLSVLNVAVSPAATATYDESVAALRNQGFADNGRKYLVFMDANVVCGYAQWYIDNRPTQDNANNGNAPGMFARVDNACWNYAEAHEIMHTLGAVLAGAPNATQYGHCNDAPEIMCYVDGAGTVLHNACAPTHARLFDCNHDDYFSTDPDPGSWLAAHWNTANSAFLIGGGPPSLTFTSSQAPLAAGSSRTLAVELRDAAGKPARADSFTVVSFVRSVGTGGVSGLESVIASGGVASLSVTGETAGYVVIQATANGISTNTTFTVVPGSVDGQSTTISAAPEKIPANGTATAQITVHAEDGHGNALTASGGVVQLSSSLGTLSPVVDAGNGTYSAVLTAGKRAGRATISGTIAGKRIGTNAVVVLAAQCTVPNLRGKRLAAARSALRAAHCALGHVRKAASRSVAAGRVISQHPKAGTRKNAGAAVAVTVSTGRRK